ncbi:MAG TPA: winged helix-turn-helix domain-containing protein [Candidatus Methylomirabilis sp.]|nr:winged helix-turn-helix domain-containing protein [Candidatus Methylomirabilis sp.]
MLEHLFGSRTRVRLISLFLNSPDEAIFVRELTRRIATQINAVRRELQNLMKLGLVREVKGGGSGDEKRPGLKRRYYQLNAVYPLLPEIKALMTKAQVLVEHRLDKELEALGQVKYAALMGSFLGVPNAPVDLFIVGTINQSTLKKLLAKIEKAIGHEVNYTVFSANEYQYRKDMMDKFLMGILNTPKNVILDRLEEKAKRA